MVAPARDDPAVCGDIDRLKEIPVFETDPTELVQRIFLVIDERAVDGEEWGVVAGARKVRPTLASIGKSNSAVCQPDLCIDRRWESRGVDREKLGPCEVEVARGEGRLFAGGRNEVAIRIRK